MTWSDVPLRARIHLFGRTRVAVDLGEFTVTLPGVGDLVLRASVRRTTLGSECRPGAGAEPRTRSGFRPFLANPAPYAATLRRLESVGGSRRDHPEETQRCLAFRCQG